MLLGELDLEELGLSGVQAAVLPAVPDSTATTMTVMTATATAITAAGMATTAPVTATMAAAAKTKLRPPKGLKRQRAQEEEAEGRRKDTGGSDTTAAGN